MTFSEYKLSGETRTAALVSVFKPRLPSRS
jgi:hypothetical protein